MRQVPLSPPAPTSKRVANVPEHPPPSTRLMSCARIANRQLPRIIGARRGREEFGWERVAKQFGAIYDLLIAQRPDLSSQTQNSWLHFVARRGSPYNAAHPRIHLTGALLNKPVAMLGATELRKWRDGLLAKGLAPGPVNRTKTGLRAALELAAAHDPRITNERAWKMGLAALPDAHVARNVILTDEEVRRIVAAAYDHDRALGLMVEVAAVTGARLSQLARLEVVDLQADGSEPRLLMPLSAKGRRRDKRH